MDSSDWGVTVSFVWSSVESRELGAGDLTISIVGDFVNQGFNLCGQ